MKKFICFILSILMTVALLLPSVYASEADTAQDDNILLDAVTYTCIHDVKNSRIVIEGTVKHDFMISHGDYTIKVFSILPGKDIISVINNENTEPLAESAMSVKFTFYIDVSATLERYSKYAIVFSSSDGTDYLAAEPMLPSISSDFEYQRGDRSGFKGVLVDSSLEIGDSGAGTVVIDVDITKTVGNAADSILFPMKDTYINISKSYITSIDKKAQSAALTGAKVYMRLLLAASDRTYAVAYSEEVGKYSIPNLHSESVLDYIFTISAFLAERYDGAYGKIHGVIPGIKIDDVENTNSIGNMTAEQYADMYTLYLVVVGNAVRSINTEIDIVIPLSNINDYSSDYYADKTIRASELFEKIMYRLDENVSGSFSCSVMIESDIAPLGINNNMISKGIDVDYEHDSLHINSDNISVFSTYLNKLSKKYDCIPSNIIYMWNVDKSLSGNALCCAYVYDYLKLVSNKDVSSFIVSFGQEAYKNFRSLKRVLQLIDSQSAEDTIAPLAKYFGMNTWSEIMEDTYDNPVLQTFITESFSVESPYDILGEFQYVDFASSSVFNCMTVGQNCDYIRSEYNSVGTRALNMGVAAMKVGDAAESICRFEYPEDYIYTPYVSLNVAVADKKARADALYEITLTLGMDKSRVVATGILRNGENAELFFDISDFSEISMSNYIKVSARCLTDDTEGFSLWLHEIKGYSDEYDSEELESLIEARRLQIRNEDVEDSGFDYAFIITVVGIVFAAAAVAVGLMIVFRRDDDVEEEE